MSLAIGIVGLPNVGKSTLFNALAGAAKAQAANYPFCTIDPNVGVVPVPDPRLARLAALFQPKKTTFTTIEFVDIAGLVAGASKGEGLGNQFLSHIRQVDAVAHVLRCFDDPDVVHVGGKVDPRGDRDVELTAREYELLDYLLLHQGRVVSREMLARDVWHEVARATPLDNVIDVHIARLRRKIDNGHGYPLIHTLRGVGFVLQEQAP